MDAVAIDYGINFPILMSILNFSKIKKILPKMRKNVVSENLPKHIAVIMDGNGRWAKARNLPRISGHLEGGKRVEEIIIASSKLGIKVLTLFTFSTENWNRPEKEVDMIMKTVGNVLNKRLKLLFDWNVQFRFSGQRAGIPEEVLKSIDHAVEATKCNSGLILNMAFNYGSRMEILDAVKKIAVDLKQGNVRVDEITEDLVSRSLYTSGLPDPDLLIRTSGEKRISNFLLWQLSYAELYFTDKFWPDFTEDELLKAITNFQTRERRYGKISSCCGVAS